MFDGAFAACDIKEGELVEKGLMRRLPEGFDGNTCPYIFTWSTERPNKVRLLLFCLLSRRRGRHTFVFFVNAWGMRYK